MHTPTWIHRRSFIWMGIAAVVLLLKAFVPTSFWDHWYYQGLFPWIRRTSDFLLSWSPMPLIYLGLSVIIIRMVMWCGQYRRGKAYMAIRALGGIAAMISLFYLLWGFNYGQEALDRRLGLDLSQAKPEEMAAEFRRATNVLLDEANSLPDSLTRDTAISCFGISDQDLRPDVVKALADLGLPHQGHVRVRQLWPSGFLLRWNTAGIYIPHVLEGHIDKGLLSVQKPFTIAHEMAHGYGVTDEGACNFIAWLACSRSKDPWVRFGGALTYWRYTAASMPWDSVGMVLQAFPPVLRRTVELINKNDRKYPDILPEFRDAVYASYLKGNGVRHGLLSYNQVVVMVQQYLAHQPTSSRSD